MILAPNANVLRVESPGAFDAFEEKYVPRLPISPTDRALWSWTNAPYRFDRRFSTIWYYGWDCASGVIWNLDAVADIKPV